VIPQQFRSDSAVNPQRFFRRRLRCGSAAIPQRFRSESAVIPQQFCSDSSAIPQ
jgi:hypothetical protein